MKCDNCGKEMTKIIDGDPVTIIGCSVGCEIKKDIPDEYVQFLEEQFGKYEIGTMYNFCWECWLDNLMGKK